MRKFLAAAAAALSTGLAPAMAQDWSGQITPYVWGAGLGGDVTPFAGAPTLSFDKSLSEVLEDTDGAFFLSGFARRDRLVLMGAAVVVLGNAKAQMLRGGPLASGRRQTCGRTIRNEGRRSCRPMGSGFRPSCSSWWAVASLRL